MKGALGAIAICALIIAVVFGILGVIVDIALISHIAYYASIALTLSIYGLFVSWIVSFDWSEAPFIKATFSGTLMSLSSIIVFWIYKWQLFHLLFVVFAIATGIAIVVGLIKTIFSL